MRQACGDKILKVILETPELDLSYVELAAKLALEFGADFVKTCTGRRGGCTPLVAGFGRIVGGVESLKTMARFAASNSRAGSANRVKPKVMSTLCGPHWGMDLCILRRLGGNLLGA